MGESIVNQKSPLFPTGPIERVREGMRVVDAAGEQVGTVEAVSMGDPEAATTAGKDPRSPGLVAAVVQAVSGEGGEPDVPEPKRSQLVRSGYVKVDGPGLSGTDRYVRSDRIADATGETVTLSVTKAQLVEER